MDGYFDVEKALGSGEVPLVQGAGAPPPPPARRAQSGSKARKFRWNSRRSGSSRRRMGLYRPDSRTLKPFRGNRSNRYKFTAPTSLTARRALRALRPAAPFIARGLLIVFLAAEVVLAYSAIEGEDFRKDIDFAVSLIACTAGVFFIETKDRAKYPLHVLWTSFVYRAFTTEHFGLAAHELTHALCVAVIHLAGSCRKSAQARKPGAAGAGAERGDAYSSMETVLSAKDFWFAAARCAIAFALVDTTKSACGDLALLVGIPLGLAFAVGYSATRSAAAVLVGLCVLTAGAGFAMGERLIPEVAAALVLMTGGSGSFTVDEMQPSNEGLVY